MSQQLREDLDVMEQENNILMRRNNQMNTIINTFKSLSDEPQSFFNINHLLSQIVKEIETSGMKKLLHD
jgi:nitrogen fixation/metabolism regulation signal transduction histidine kinase